MPPPILLVSSGRAHASGSQPSSASKAPNAGFSASTRAAASGIAAVSRRVSSMSARISGRVDQITEVLVLGVIVSKVAHAERLLDLRPRVRPPSLCLCPIPRVRPRSCSRSRRRQSRRRQPASARAPSPMTPAVSGNSATDARVLPDDDSPDVTFAHQLLDRINELGARDFERFLECPLSHGYPF